MKDNGKMANAKATVTKYLQTGMFIMAATKTVNRMVKVYFAGRKERYSTESGKQESSMAMECGEV